MINFDKFDKSMDLEGLRKDVAEAQQNSTGEFKEVPANKYEVAITKLELAVSKNGNPMVTCWMKIVSGEYENSMLFMNQVVTQGFQLHQANKFLRKLVEDMDINVEFVSFSQYAELILDISEQIDGQREYLVDYTVKNGFNNYEILEVYDLE